MTQGRWILLATGIALAGCAAVFAIVGGNWVASVATAIAALAAVAGVGVSAWAASTSRTRAPSRVEVSDTGDIRARGASDATTGVVIAGGTTPNEVTVRRTGSIEGGGGVTGYRQG